MHTKYNSITNKKMSSILFYSISVFKAYEFECVINIITNIE